MADWQEDFQEAMETLAQGVEEWLRDVGETIAAIAEELEGDIGREIEYFFGELWDEGGDGSREGRSTFLADLSDDSDFFLNPKVEPTPETHPACMGCCHYHGRVYRGNLLVCAMHPYGWQDANCPDWQALG